MKLSKITFLLWIMLSYSLFAADSSVTAPIVADPHRGVIPSVIAPENIVRLVFMGKTGAGKSTTINAFYNFAKGIKYDAYPKHFPIPTSFQSCNVPEYVLRHTEDLTRGQLGAVTQEPSEYMATGDDLVLSLIDCPGTADPRGVVRDMEITKDIADFMDQFGDFNAIVLVLNGSLARGTVEENYYIEQIKTIIPRTSLDRVFIILTNATRVTQNVKDFVAEVGLPLANVFALDHFALSREGYLSLGSDEELATEVELKWSLSRKAFDKVIKKSKDLGKYSTDEMARISAIKSATSERIFASLRMVDRIEQTEQALETAKADLEIARAEYERASSGAESAELALRLAAVEKQAADAVDAYETYKTRELYPTPQQHNTLCLPCGVVCHLACGLDYKGPYYTDHLPGCSAMSDGYCTQCPNRCHYKSHSHRFEKWKTVTKKREKLGVRARQVEASNCYNQTCSSLDNKKQYLIEKTTERDQQRTNRDDIQTCLDNLVRQKTDLQNEIVALYVELDRVSMGSISLHIGEYYDMRITNEYDVIKKEKLQRERRFYTEQVELYKQRIGRI